MYIYIDNMYKGWGELFDAALELCVDAEAPLGPP